MGANHIVIDHCTQVVIGQTFDFVNFVGGAEAVEKVHKWNARTQGGSGRYCGGILRFLWGVAGKQTPTSLAYCHDIRMVAENRQRLSCD